MKKDTEENVMDIMIGLDKEATPDVQVQRIKSPDEKLRESLLNFVSKQIDEIQKLDVVIALSLNNLIGRLQTNELSASEVLNIINTLSNKKVDVTTSILEPFKPTPNGTNVLLPPAKEGNEFSDFERGMKEMSKEDLKVLEGLFRAIQSNKND